MSIVPFDCRPYADQREKRAKFRFEKENSSIDGQTQIVIVFTQLLDLWLFSLFSHSFSIMLQSDALNFIWQQKKAAKEEEMKNTFEFLAVNDEFICEANLILVRCHRRAVRK